jgi:PAS domain S-box-containing protein
MSLPASKAQTEEDRLAALRHYDILDTPRERDFDDLVQLAADLLDAPMAAVTLVDRDRQWFKSEVGLCITETARENSICAQAIHAPGPTIVHDLSKDPVFAAMPIVADSGLGFYAGMPLETPDGLRLGMLCVLDTKSRPDGFTARQTFALSTLARQVSAQLELRRIVAEKARSAAETRQIIDSATDHAIIALDLDGRVTCWNDGAARITGWSEPEMLGEPLARIFTPEDKAADRVGIEMRRALAEGSSPDRRWHLRRNGERFWADGEMRPITHSDGTPVGLVKVFSDRVVEREAEQRLTLLAQASADLLAAGEPDGVLGPLLAQGAELLGFDQAHSYTLPADGAGLTLTSAIGGPPSVNPICCLVAQTRQPLILDHVQDSPDPVHATARAAGLRAYAGLPVLANGRLHGVLSFGSTTRDSFGEEALSFFATLARFIAVVRERLDRETQLRELNATLGERVEARTRERDRVWQVSRDMLGVASLDGVWQSLNPAWTLVLGWPRDQLRGRDLEHLIHPDDLAKTREEFARLAAGQTTLSFENRLRTAGGDYRLLSWTAVPVEGLVYCVARDMTGERERERALADSRDFARLALSAVGGVGVWILDIRAETFACDAALAELYGLAPDTDLDAIPREVFLANVHPDDRLRLRNVMSRGLDQPGEVELEYRINHPDGLTRWVLLRGNTKFDADGNPTRRTGVGIETTRQHNLEEQLRQAQKMEAVGQLTGGLAHDFNNLLTGIVGSLELLETRIGQNRLEGVDRYIAAAQGAARRASALTHRLLAFSRRQTLDPKPTDPNRLIADMEDLIRRTVGPEITVDMAPAGEAWNLLVDASQLESALLNLCINARDAMPNGGRLTVETVNRVLDEPAARARELPPGAYVSLSVTDNGVGMPPDVVARAFDPFFTTKPIGQGTGLGLSMIYGFVRQSAGQVRIHSQEGHGTTVSLLLPRHIGDAEVAVEPAALSDAPRADRNQSVLIVDDEPTVRMLVADVLGDLGYNAIEAGDGATAMRSLQSPTRIDLLVTDVGLPGGMNGRQLADAARVARPGLKVLFITGYAENAVLSHGHLDPGMHVLTKPFAMETLATRIKDVLGEASRTSA